MKSKYLLSILCLTMLLTGCATNKKPSSSENNVDAEELKIDVADYLKTAEDNLKSGSFTIYGETSASIGLLSVPVKVELISTLEDTRTNKLSASLKVPLISYNVEVLDTREKMNINLNGTETSVAPLSTDLVEMIFNENIRNQLLEDSFSSVKSEDGDVIITLAFQNSENFLNDILSKLGTSSLNLGVDKMTFTINPNNVHYKEIRIDGHLTINDQNFKAVLPLVIS